VLKKTSAYTGLVIVTAAGALLTSSPAYALDGLVRGSHVRNHYRSHHRNHNWNGHRHHARIFIRIYIYNKNNNHAVAVARPEHRRHAFLPSSVPVGGTVTAPLTTGALTRRTRANEGTAASAPASSNQAPASTNTAPDQGSTGTVGTPSTTGAAAPALDESATGNVSP